jgi:iron(III) transport system substrate-binding protein
LLAGCGSPGGGPTSSSGAGSAGGASGAGSAAAPSALDTLRAAAASEGTLEVYIPSTLAPDGLKQLQDAINARYGLNAEFKHTLAGLMTRDAARVIGEIAAGQPPTWDLMFLTDSQYATFFNNDVLERTDWAALGVAYPKAIAYDGTTLAYSTQFITPAYNTSLVRPEEAPKDWQDLTDPRWRGKIGVSTSTHHWARLAQLWGDERTTRLIDGLAAQQLVLGQPGETQSRLQLDEVAIIASTSDGQIHDARTSGAPIVAVDTVRPIVAGQYNAGILKGVRRPNLARLTAAFLMTPEAQTILDSASASTSMYLDGSPAYRYAQGKEIVSLDAKFAADQLDPLTEKYGRILGFR